MRFRELAGLPAAAACLVAGDFNGWRAERGRASRVTGSG